MKKILATTDFSPASRNAVNYAAELALSFGAKLILLHVYSVPVMLETTIPVISLEDLEKDSRKRLKQVSASLIKKHSKGLEVECICRCGFAVEEILAAGKEAGIDLVVMGMQGAGYIDEKLNGSITTAVISRAVFPVMSIGTGIRFKKPSKIVFASDLNPIENIHFIRFLNAFSNHFESRLMILNVFSPGNVMPTIAEAAESMKLDKILKSIKHSFHFVENKNVVEGINQFAKAHDASLVIMLPHEHSVFYKLFSEPQSKRMAFHAGTALLTFKS